MTDITELTAEKLEEIRQRYRPTLAPKCHICGVEMTIQRMSASRITYGCAGAIYDETGCHYAEGRSLADDHYAESRITVVDVSDPDVLAMVEALEKAQQVDEELCKLLPPGAEYMDPPDGGDVTPLEGVRRMVADYRQRIAELREWNAGLAQESFERQQRISELLEGKVGNALLERENHHVKVVGKLTEHINQLESRTVKLVDCDFGAVQHMSGGSTDYCHGFVDGTQNAIRSISAAGIKVEAE